jgi:serine/threonine protein kinase/Tfp pilus assembly protein PilF
MPDQSRAKEIFVTAVEKYKPDQWSVFLDGACGEDGELRARVEELLAAHRQNDSFLDHQAATIDSGVEETSGSIIGPFKLLQKIGEGGFGVVYMAEQTKPVRRKVALKIIKPGMDSKEVIARFEAERQALAMMDHPNIAKVLDAGATDSGRPYFAMELVKGVTITEYADNNHLSTKDRLTLFASICRAVHHAHQKGVIHRDLKPSNVMVTLHDGKPVAKVIDFGVSKAVSQPLTEQTLFTRYGQVIGTPQYMSPEQAEMSGLDVDTRSDIYSLGVILHELLTGRTPFSSEQIRAAGFDEMRRMIKEQEPLRPSNALQTLDADTATSVAANRACRPDALHKLVRGELDWIVMRSLEKDRNRRYDSANSLAEDIDRHLNDEPVEASPPSLAYRAWKSYRRNRWACIASATIAASLLIGLGLAIYGMQTSRRSEGQAIAARVETEKQRLRAEEFAKKATLEADSSKDTLDLLLGLLAKANINPDTGNEYTVREALAGLVVRNVSKPSPDVEEEPEARRQTKETLPPQVAVNLHLALGKAYLQSDSKEIAAQHFASAASASRSVFGEQSLETAACLRHLGQASVSKEPLEQAIAIERALNSKENLAVSLTDLGRLLAEQGAKAEAIQTFAEATKYFVPRQGVLLDEIPQLHLARVYRSQSDAASEEKYLKLAIEAAKKSFDVDRQGWLSRGKSLRGQQRFDESELALLVADSLSSGSEPDEPAFYLGRIYMDTGHLGQAEVFFRKSIQQAKLRSDTNRADNSAWFLGEVLARTGRFSDAIEYFKVALESRHTNSQQCLAMLMVLALESPELGEWLKDYRRQLESEVTDESTEGTRATAAGLLARFELVDGNMERCFELLDIAKLEMLGMDKQHLLLMSRGHLAESASFSQNAIFLYASRQPGKTEFWKQTNLARALYHLHDFERGEAVLRDVVRKSKELTPRDDYLH